MAVCENISRYLQEVKRTRGLSVTEFSEELEISRSSLQALLNCKGNPRADTIEHIANKLQIDPIVLLTASAGSPRDEHLEELTELLLEKIKLMFGEENE